MPRTTGELAAVIYNSLAKCYADTLAHLEENTGKHYDTVYVVGGGSKAGYLNELTAKYTGKAGVGRGRPEATAIGNLAGADVKRRHIRRRGCSAGLHPGSPSR